MAKKKKEKTYTEERVEEFLNEDEPPKPPEDDVSPEPETEEPETPETPEKAETGEPEKPVEPEIDVSEVKEELKKEVKDALIRTITGKSEVEIEAKTPWAKEKRTPKDYDEIAEWAKDEAKKEMRTEDTEAKTKAQKESDDNLQYWNEKWDNELDSLAKAGHIPERTNQNDPNDPGVKARREIFTEANKHKEYNLKVAFYEHVSGKKKQPAGADAPIAGGGKTVTKEPEGEFSYEEISKAGDLHDLL